MSEATQPDLTGMTFREIAAKYGEEAAIQAGIAADPEWGPEEMDMSNARPAMEVMPDLVGFLENGRPPRETGPQENPTVEYVNIGMDSDLMAYFRETGSGWQIRLNNMLRQVVFGAGAPESRRESLASEARAGNSSKG